jgi:small subunit ribosomal protein S20|tara:strand:- start:11255 stop:11515 length:261 start_codon:yes stop_codon:yes gene_type:complete
MANTNLSVKKRYRQQMKNLQRNQHYKSQMKTAIKNVLVCTDKADAEKHYPKVISLIDSLVSKGVIHKNTAGRKKSLISHHLNSLSQ